MLSEVARRETRAIEPSREERSGWPREVVPLAIGDRTWRLADQDHARIFEDRRADGVRVDQKPRLLTGSTCQDRLGQTRQGARLTLIRTHTYAQSQVLAPGASG